MKKMKFIFIGMLFLFSVSFGMSQGLTPHQIDSLVEKTMETFNVPGMAVSVVKDGEIIVEKGYGIQSIKSQKPVDTKTRFGIASNTKAFTTAAIAQLVDQGKMKWDTKVTDIIPEFKLYNPYVTDEFTVKDLLVHRSGLGLGAGDLMVFPAANTTTLEEMIHNLRYLKPVSSFRTKFDYDNLFYIVAGEIVARVSGEDFESYLENHFFKPLGMNRATMNSKEIDKDKNRIDGHAPVDGELMITRKTFTKIGDAAAGIYASIEDMTKWVQARIDYGKYGKKLEKSLFSEEQAHEMWKPVTLLNPRKKPYNSQYRAYSLGWFVEDANGYLQASHTGGLMGIVSQVTLVPELNLGIVVLTNQESGAAFSAITTSILDRYFGIEGEDRINEYNQSRLKAEKRAKEIEKAIQKEVENQSNSSAPLPSKDEIVGRYQDEWFGEVVITQEKDGTIQYTSVKSPDLTGKMTYYKGTTYIVRWEDASLKADAFVNFKLDTEGKAVGFLMQAISPLTDFSFNFHDLDFNRIK